MADLESSWNSLYLSGITGTDSVVSLQSEAARLVSILQKVEEGYNGHVQFRVMNFRRCS